MATAAAESSAEATAAAVLAAPTVPQAPNATVAVGSQPPAGAIVPGGYPQQQQGQPQHQQLAVAGAQQGVQPVAGVAGFQQPGAQGFSAGSYGGYQQPGVYGQPGGYPGQQYPGAPGAPGMPGAPGAPGQPQMEMVPQFTFRTLVRSFTEVAATIQGCALLMMMGKNWTQEMGSNEEQPLRRFGVFLKNTFVSMIPFVGSIGKRRDLEAAWAREANLPPARPTPWWVLFGFAYFAVAFLQQWREYRRILAAKAVAVLQAEGDAEGDAAGGGTRNEANKKSVVGFYMQKQRELHQQRTEARASGT